MMPCRSRLASPGDRASSNAFHQRALISWWWRSGSLLVTFRSAWTVQRCSSASGQSSRTAFQMPGAPSAMAVVERDLDALVAHLRFPSEHRKRIRTTNLLERTFVEVRRRTKVIGRFPGETSALSLIWAVLELSSRGWRGVKMNPKTVAEIERLRRQLRENPAPPAATDTEEVIAA